MTHEVVSGTKTGVQAQIKKVAAHALFVHSHMLQLACHCSMCCSSCQLKPKKLNVFSLWKFFHFSKENQEVQHVLDLPEMKLPYSGYFHDMAKML